MDNESLEKIFATMRPVRVAFDISTESDYRMMAAYKKAHGGKSEQILKDIAVDRKGNCDKCMLATTVCRIYGKNLVQWEADHQAKQLADKKRGVTPSKTLAELESVVMAKNIERARAKMAEFDRQQELSAKAKAMSLAPASIPTQDPSQATDSAPAAAALLVPATADLSGLESKIMLDYLAKAKTKKAHCYTVQEIARAKAKAKAKVKADYIFNVPSTSKVNVPSVSRAHAQAMTDTNARPYASVESGAKVNLYSYFVRGSEDFSTIPANSSVAQPKLTMLEKQEFKENTQPGMVNPNPVLSQELNDAAATGLAQQKDGIMEKDIATARTHLAPMNKDNQSAKADGQDEFVFKKPASDWNIGKPKGPTDDRANADNARLAPMNKDNQSAKADGQDEFVFKKPASDWNIAQPKGPTDERANADEKTQAKEQPKVKTQAEYTAEAEKLDAVAEQAAKSIAHAQQWERAMAEERAKAQRVQEEVPFDVVQREAEFLIRHASMVLEEPLKCRTNASKKRVKTDLQVEATDQLVKAKTQAEALKKLSRQELAKVKADKHAKIMAKIDAEIASKKMTQEQGAKAKEMAEWGRAMAMAMAKDEQREKEKDEKNKKEDSNKNTKTAK